MSVENIVLPPGIIRDWIFTNPLAAGQTIKGSLEEALILDLFVRNRGGAALTILTNGQAAITVDPGDVYTRNATVMMMIEVVSAVLYDFEITGVKYATLKAMGLI